MSRRKEKFYDGVGTEEILESLAKIETASSFGSEVSNFYTVEIMDFTGNYKKILRPKGYMTLDGKEKSMKSTLNKMMITAHLSYGGVYENIRLSIDPRKVFLIPDTEQDDEDLKSAKDQIMRGANLKTFPEDKILFKMFSVESDAAVKMNILLKYIMDLKHDLGFLMIDGIVDFIYDDNNKGDCRDMMNELIALKNEYGFNMSTIIHQNKNNDFAANQLGNVCNGKAHYHVKTVPPQYKGGPALINSGHAIRGKGYFEPFEVYYDENDLPRANLNVGAGHSNF